MTEETQNMAEEILGITKETQNKTEETHLMTDGTQTAADGTQITTEETQTITEETSDVPEKPKIILVDDLNFFLVSTKKRLSDYYQIYAAQSTEALYILLEKVKPDLILLDINMPDVDGFETVQQLKADPDYADIPVIFLTSKTDKASIIKGLKLGALDFISKPFIDKDIIQCINDHLGISVDNELKPVILAVDDNPSILRSIKAVLDDDYRVYTLTEPQMVSEVLKKVNPDLFLLDWKMPGLTGGELVPIIRKNINHQDTPIVFLTSEGTVDNLTVAINLGINDFILKPIDDKILHDKLKLCLKDYILRRRLRSF